MEVSKRSHHAALPWTVRVAAARNVTVSGAEASEISYEAPQLCHYEDQELVLVFANVLWHSKLAMRMSSASRNRQTTFRHSTAAVTLMVRKLRGTSSVSVVSAARSCASGSRQGIWRDLEEFQLPSRGIQRNRDAARRCDPSRPWETVQPQRTYWYAVGPGSGIPLRWT